MQPKGTRSAFTEVRWDRFSGWTLTIILCLVPLILWLQLHPPSVLIRGDFSSTMRDIGRVTGLIGMVMYALNLIYATRLRFLENLFGGLNRVYIAHHVMGGLALVFLCLHPLFLALRYVSTSIRDAAFLMIPHDMVPVKALFDSNHILHYDVLDQWAIFFGIIAFWGMVILLIFTFFIKLPYRIWLATHKFLGFAFFLAGLHVLFIASDTSRNGALKYYLLTISFLGLAAFVYRTLMGKVFIRQYKYYVDEVKTVAGNVSQLILRPVDKKMDHQPGQFVFIRFLFSGVKDITTEWHPFSISSKPGSDTLQISAKALGDYTGALPKLKKGAIAEIEGAYGKFSYTNYKNKDQIWIAGGIGITPFLSMAKSLPDDGYSIDLYYSVKSESELVEWQELAEIAQSKNGKFRLIPFVADTQKGFLTTDFMLKYSKVFGGKEIFICGPPPMMKSMRQQLKDRGVPNKMIHSEEFAMS
jgi:predicted ferric reductase